MAVNFLFAYSKTRRRRGAASRRPRYLRPERKAPAGAEARVSRAQSAFRSAALARALFAWPPPSLLLLQAEREKSRAPSTTVRLFSRAPLRETIRPDKMLCRGSAEARFAFRSMRRRRPPPGSLSRERVRGINSPETCPGRRRRTRFYFAPRGGIDPRWNT